MKSCRAFSLGVLLGLAALLALPAAGNGAAGDSRELFQAVEAGGTPVGILTAAVIRSHPIKIRFDLLAPGEEATAPKALPRPFRLTLFDGVAYTALTRRIKTTPRKETVWTGRLEGIPESEFTLVIKGTRLFGNISVPGAAYRIRPAGDGLHTLMEINQRAYPPEKVPRPVLDFPEEPANQEKTGEVQAPSPKAGMAAGGFRIFLPLILAPPYVDVLVVYTPVARGAAGGRAAIEALIELAVSETNTGYENSGVNQILRLVHTEEVGYDETGFDWDITLDRLTLKNDGYMDQVHTLRDAHGADVVVLLVDDYSYCGLAWLMTAVSPTFAASAFSLVNWDCATGLYSFAHEIGHNMGSHHDWATTDEIGAFPYSKGYQAPNEAFRTIMAYDCPGGCTRINYWSNPDVLYKGQPTGRQYQAPQPADNRRSLNSTFPTVGKWR